jgi:hypothetical protein
MAMPDRAAIIYPKVGVYKSLATDIDYPEAEKIRGLQSQAFETMRAVPI